VESLIDRTRSGGVTVNDCMLHVAQDDLPFGGIGPSGMGQYHGVEGFRTFSKARPIFRQARFNTLPLLAPPYWRAGAAPAQADAGLGAGQMRPQSTAGGRLTRRRFLSAGLLAGSLALGGGLLFWPRSVPPASTVRRGVGTSFPRPMRRR